MRGGRIKVPLLAGHDGSTLKLAGQFYDFQGIRTSIAKKPYDFVIFQGGSDPLPPPPSGSAHGGAPQTLLDLLAR